MICYTDYSLSLVSTHSRGPVTSVLPPPKKNTSYRRLFSLHCEQALVTKFRLKPQPRIMPSAAAHGTLTETPTGHSYWKCVHKNLFSLEGFNVVIKFSVKKKKKKMWLYCRVFRHFKSNMQRMVSFKFKLVSFVYYCQEFVSRVE